MDLSESAPINDSFNDEESATNSFSIQPYRFEPRRNSDKSVSDNESISGEESEEENTNPRLENSDCREAFPKIWVFVRELPAYVKSGGLYLLSGNNGREK